MYAGQCRWAGGWAGCEHWESKIWTIGGSDRQNLGLAAEKPPKFAARGLRPLAKILKRVNLYKYGGAVAGAKSRRG